MERNPSFLRAHNVGGMHNTEVQSNQLDIKEVKRRDSRDLLFSQRVSFLIKNR